ncbi:DnaB-like helicase C-terminal domain-containing protein [Aeoliella sp.]|uniref:DnaB-like helicase C-terminal domain-containing protein n=1 Tax=Aeoliella sp. TaxID=2795800 RepID=UPI003CCBFAFD
MTMYNGAQTSSRSDCTADIQRPRDPEAEKWTIASMLIDGATAPEVFATVQPDDFDDELGQAAAWACHDALQAGEPIDANLVLRRMRNTGSDIGELAGEYIAELLQEFPTAAHARHYASKVAEAARKRQLLDMALRVVHDINHGHESSDIVPRVFSDASAVVDQYSFNGDPWRAWEKSLADTDRLTYWEPGGNNSQLNRLNIGPEQLVLVGAAPGMGKTALALQLILNILMQYPDTIAMVGNCEMPTGVMLDRMLAYLAHVPYGVIRDRRYRGENLDKVLAASKLLLSLKPRLHFMGPPFTMARLKALSASVGASVVLCDYIQRFRPTTEASDQRQRVSDVMSDCREIAMQGPALIAVSAMSRQGQFRESSECEYACDTGFVLLDAEHQDPTVDGRQLVAKCIKNRHGAMADIELTFDGRFQEHTAPPEVAEWDDFAEYGTEAALA